MKTDGKFIINNGGITQGIKQELGLSSDECKQLKSNSIWDKIIKELDNPNNMQVSDNQNVVPNQDNSYLVYKKAVIQFSKECWQRIVNMVNDTLHKNIQIEDTKETTNANNLNTNTSTDVVTQNKQNLENAYKELKAMSGLLAQKYNIEESYFVNFLTSCYTSYLKAIPNTSINSADFAASMLMDVLSEQLSEKSKKEIVEIAITEAAQHFKDSQGEISGYSCSDIINNDDVWKDVINIYADTEETLTSEEISDSQEDFSYKPTTNEITNAINKILLNLSKLQLPEGIKIEELQETLKMMNTENIKYPSRKLSQGDIENTLLLEALKNLCPGADINELKKCSIKNIIKISPDETIANVKVSELNDKFINDLINIKEVTPPNSFRIQIEKATKILKEELPRLTDNELKILGISAEKRDRLLSYVENIFYDNTHGSGQAIGRWIVISTKWPDANDISSTTAMLIHEANHCDEEYLSQYPELSEQDNNRFRNTNGQAHNYRYSNTQEEEENCETLSMLLSAMLIKKGCMSDFIRYEQDAVSGYIDEQGNVTQQLNNYINDFKDCYTNYPENLNGNITVRHSLEEDGVVLSEEERRETITIQPGDIIKIGDKEYTIGYGQFLLSPLDSAPIFELVGENGKVANNIVFDDVVPNQTELDLMARRTLNENDKNRTKGNFVNFTIIRDGQKLYTGKCYNT